MRRPREIYGVCLIVCAWLWSSALGGCGGTEDDDFDFDIFVGSDDPSYAGGGAAGGRGEDGCFDREDARISELGSSPTECDLAFSCPTTDARFDDACGCGCAARSLICPPQSGERYTETDPAACDETSATRCRDDEAYFVNDCGCGCVPEASGSGGESDACDGLDTFNEMDPVVGFETGALCGSYVVCAGQALSTDDLTLLFGTDVITSCDFRGVVASCPVTTNVVCIGFTDVIRASERVQLCSAVESAGLTHLGCAPTQ